MTRPVEYRMIRGPLDGTVIRVNGAPPLWLEGFELEEALAALPALRSSAAGGYYQLERHSTELAYNWVTPKAAA